MASEEQTTNSELRDMLSQLLKTEEQIVSKLDRVSSEVKQLTYRLSQVEKSVESQQGSRPDQAACIANCHQEIQQVRGSISTALVFTNPFNVVFYGIDNRPGKQLDAVFRNFMVEMLHIDQAKAYSFPVHGQYLPKMSQEDAHFPICVTFRAHKDKEYVCQKMSKYSRQLQDMDISAEGLHVRLPAIWKS